MLGHVQGICAQLHHDWDPLLVRLARGGVSVAGAKDFVSHSWVVGREVCQVTPFVFPAP